MARPDAPSAVDLDDDGSVSAPGPCYAPEGAPPDTFSRLFAVWGSSGSNDVFATTSRGPILHYDGTDWTPMHLQTGAITAEGAMGVWGADAGNVFAVDAGTIWHYNGTDWQLSAMVDASSLRRVWGSGPSNVYTVGQRYTASQTLAAVWRYDGDQWAFVPSEIQGDRWDVWGSDPDDVYIVGNSSSAGLIAHYDGSAWTTSSIMLTPTLQGVWGSRANDVYAVGGGARNGFCCSGEGTILHFDGGSWKTVMERGQFK